MVKIYSQKAYHNHQTLRVLKRKQYLINSFPLHVKLKYFNKLTYHSLDTLYTVL